MRAFTFGMWRPKRSSSARLRKPEELSPWCRCPVAASRLIFAKHSRECPGRFVLNHLSSSTEIGGRLGRMRSLDNASYSLWWTQKHFPKWNWNTSSVRCAPFGSIIYAQLTFDGIIFIFDIKLIKNVRTLSLISVKLSLNPLKLSTAAQHLSFQHSFS